MTEGEKKNVLNLLLTAQLNSLLQMKSFKTNDSRKPQNLIETEFWKSMKLKPQPIAVLDMIVLNLFTKAFKAVSVEG